MSQDPACAPSPLTALLTGFDGRPPVEGAQAALPWRIGRWLRTQGARRPSALRIINADAAMVDGRILAIDASGAVQDLSTTRRASSLSTLARKSI